MIEKILKDSGYIANQELEIALDVALSSSPSGAILEGPPGCGKTFLAEVVCKATCASVEYYACVQGTVEDNLFYKLVPDASVASGISMRDAVLLKALKKSRSAKVGVIVDEIDKAPASCDPVFLSFLQSAKVALGDEEIVGRKENLVVFYTTNGERDLSEALRRRVAWIKFPPLPMSVVREALELTHANHERIPDAMKVYALSLRVNLDKPVTIQELRQLLDACTLLGEKADWNILVRTLVAKSDGNMELLSEALKLKPAPEERVTISVPDLTENWNEEIAEPVSEDVEFVPFVPKMPKISVPFKTGPASEEEKEVSCGAVMKATAETADMLIKSQKLVQKTDLDFGLFRNIGANFVGEKMKLEPRVAKYSWKCIKEFTVTFPLPILDNFKGLVEIQVPLTREMLVNSDGIHSSGQAKTSRYIYKNTADEIAGRFENDENIHFRFLLSSSTLQIFVDENGALKNIAPSGDLIQFEIEDEEFRSEKERENRERSERERENIEKKRRAEEEFETAKIELSKNNRIFQFLEKYLVKDASNSYINFVGENDIVCAVKARILKEFSEAETKKKNRIVREILEFDSGSIQIAGSWVINDNKYRGKYERVPSRYFIQEINEYAVKAMEKRIDAEFKKIGKEIDQDVI